MTAAVVVVLVTAGVQPASGTAAARHSTQVSTAAHGSSTAAHRSTGQQDGTGQHQQWRVAGVQRHSSTSQRGGAQVGGGSTSRSAHSTSRSAQHKSVKASAAS